MAANLLLLLLGIVIFALVVPPVLLLMFYLFDQRQKQHAVLRNYPILGRVRYGLEKVGPELRQYLFDSDNESKPLSRVEYQSIVMSGKYLKNMIGFGSRRDFEAEGYYIRNDLFPRLMEELHTELVRVSTKKYVIEHESLTTRREHQVDTEANSWLLREEEAVVVGKNRSHPFRLRGQIGMSGMSYGALGERAITALSEGLALAGNAWMNTGEGGVSQYHLRGEVDLIMQIGPGLFGVREEDGSFSWKQLRKLAEAPRIRAFELKLGQGAKIRGGHLEGQKVTPEIAEIRKIPVGRTVDSPSRFREFSDEQGLLTFVHRMQQETGKPVGVKLVVGGPEGVDTLVRKMAGMDIAPDFITVDGGEGGSGATYQEMADSVGLPLRAALPIVDGTLKKYGLRDEVTLFASGKLFSADRIAIALGLGADLVNIARGFMIAAGCIQALRCHTNTCPVGVATTDPKLQQGLVVEEKKYRVANYLLTLREGLFNLASAAGLESPCQFDRQHVLYKDKAGRVYTTDELFPQPAFEKVQGRTPRSGVTA